MTDDRRIEYIPLDDVAPATRNPKRHRTEALTASVNRFGFVAPALRDERTGRLVAGHGRTQALRTLRDAGATPPDGVQVDGDGRWLVPIIVGWSSRSDAEADAYLVADNRHTELGGWDSAELVDLLGGLGDEELLAATGYTDDDLTALLAGLDEGADGGAASSGAGGDGDYDDEPPPPPRDPVTKRGDVWQLGPHRIACGDCRDANTVGALMGGNLVNLAFTSPPYADRRDYDESSGFVPIPPAEYVEWFAPVAANVRDALADDGSWFVNIKPGVTPDSLDTELYVLDLVAAHAREWGWHFATEFCWERTGVPKNVTLRFKNQFEPVYQFTKGRWKMRPEAVRHPSDSVPAAGGAGVGQTSWHGTQGNGGAFAMRKRRNGTGEFMSDVQGVAKDVGEFIGPGLAFPGNRLPTFNGSHEATGHTAAFPVGLPEFFIKAYTDPGDVIFDPFMGSGSTLLAADRTDRVAYGIELSPAYVDVICRRYQKATGTKPVLESTGIAHDFTDGEA